MRPDECLHARTYYVRSYLKTSTSQARSLSNGACRADLLLLYTLVADTLLLLCELCCRCVHSPRLLRTRSLLLTPCRFDRELALSAPSTAQRAAILHALLDRFAAPAAPAPSAVTPEDDTERASSSIASAIATRTPVVTSALANTSNDSAATSVSLPTAVPAPAPSLAPPLAPFPAAAACVAVDASGVPSGPCGSEGPDLAALGQRLGALDLHAEEGANTPPAQAPIPALLQSQQQLPQAPQDSSTDSLCREDIDVRTWGTARLIFPAIPSPSGRGPPLDF